MTPHIHISALEGVKVMIYVLIGLGTLHILARKFEGHPLANTIMSVYG